MLGITRNIAEAYKEADIQRKKAYLHFFFKEFLIKDMRVVEVKYHLVIGALKEANSVILSKSWLPIRNLIRLLLTEFSDKDI